MFLSHPKPRYSKQMESGVLHFLAPEKAHGKDMVFKVGISQQRNNVPKLIWDQDVGINHDSLQLTAKLKTT